MPSNVSIGCMDIYIYIRRRRRRRRRRRKQTEIMVVQATEISNAWSLTKKKSYENILS
jgi:hypothetical protein